MCSAHLLYCNVKLLFCVHLFNYLYYHVCMCFRPAQVDATRWCTCGTLSLFILNVWGKPSYSYGVLSYTCL